MRYLKAFSFIQILLQVLLSQVYSQFQQGYLNEAGSNTNYILKLGEWESNYYNLSSMQTNVFGKLKIYPNISSLDKKLHYYLSLTKVKLPQEIFPRVFNFIDRVEKLVKSNGSSNSVDLPKIQVFMSR